MDLETLGRWVAVGGVAVVVAGLLLWAAGRAGLGSLPGDIRIQRDGWGCYLPIATSLLLSIVLTLVLDLVLRLMRRK